MIKHHFLKTFVFCCIALLHFSLLSKVALCSTIYLKGYDEPIGVDIITYTEEYISVIISRASVGAIDVKKGSSSKYGDSILLGVDKIKIPCKVLTFTVKDATVQIPQEAITSIYALGKPGTFVSEPPPISKNEKSNPVELNTDMIEELTEKITRRVRREALLEKEAVERGRMVVPELLSPDERIQEKKKFGTVVGRILASGTPLPQCEIKLVMLVDKKDLWRKIYKIEKSVVPFDAVTNTDGQYKFEWVPPGIYKIYWQPKSLQKWVRKRKVMPDVEVYAGETVSFQDVETNLPAVVVSTR